MKLINLAIPTLVVSRGMTLCEVFRECAQRNVAGLPYVDGHGTIVGRLSLRDIIKNTCIPDFLIDAAHYLGDNIHTVDLPPEQCRAILTRDAKDYVLETIATVSSESPLIKGLAIMERYNSSYLFLVDDGDYKGVVTRMAIIRRMLSTCVTEDAS